MDFSVLDDDGVSRMLKLQIENPLDYTDKWPAVETTVKVDSFSNLDIVGCTFRADFTVTLDWLDFSLVEDVHYAQNIKNGCYVLSKWLWNTDQLFNPMIRIDNRVEGEFEHVADGSDEYPRIMTILHTQENENSVLRDVPWIMKDFHFRGTLGISRHESAWFPLDAPRLPIKIASVPLVGRTTLGHTREITLMDPILRLEYFSAEKKLEKRMRDTEPIDTSPPLQQWPQDWNLGNNGEMVMVGFGVQNPKHNLYQVEILLIRRGTRYVFDFIIQLLLFSCSTFSCWVPFTPECLPSRLSITLVVLLTVVASTTQRPTVIAELPYPTFHDTFERWIVVFTVAIALENIVVYNLCFHNGEPDLDQWGCVEVPFMGTTSRYDLISVLTLIFFMIIVVFMQISRAQCDRIAALLCMHKEHHMNDYEAEERSLDRFHSARIAFPKDSFDLCVKSQRTLDTILRAVDVEDRCWRIIKPVCIDKKRLFPGHCLRHDNLHEFTGVARPWYCLGARSSVIFPTTFRVSEEDFATTKNRLMVFSPTMVNKQRFQPYDGQTPQLAVGIMAALVLPCTAGFLLNMSLRLMEKKMEQKGSICPAHLKSPCRKSRETSDETPICKLIQDEPNPSINPEELTLLIDIGSGEVGFYGYKLQHVNTTPCTSPSSLASDEEKSETTTVVLQIPKEKHRMEGTFFTDYVDAMDGEKRLGDLIAKHFCPVIEKGQIDGELSIYVGCTGSNRTLLDNGEDRKRFKNFIVTKVKTYLKNTMNVHARLCMYSPLPEEEAEYELRAVEYLVQRTNLDVQNVESGSSQEFAEFEIQEALNGRSIGENVTIQDFLQEFRDLKLSYCTLVSIFKDCPNKLQLQLEVSNSRRLSPRRTPTRQRTALFSKDYVDPKQRSVESMARHIRNTPLMLRSLVMARLFCGTLAAGGGSTQFTFKSTQKLCEVLYKSIPVGNKVPLVAEANESPLWPPEGITLTNDDLERWRNVVRSHLEANGMPRAQRGFYVGISAIAHAAKKAGIADRILPRSVCLRHLQDTILFMDRSDPKERLNFSNLIMVYEVVKWVLHSNAFIVCKREWEQDCTEEKVVATWSLGFWLKAIDGFKKAGTTTSWTLSRGLRRQEAVTDRSSSMKTCTVYPSNIFYSMDF